MVDQSNHTVGDVAQAGSDSGVASEAGKAQFERLKTYAEIAKWIITSVVIGGVSLFLNHQYQTAKLEQQKIEQEGEYLSKFVEHALDTDLETRIKFAHYFFTLTVNEKIKENWEIYHNGLITQRKISIDELNVKAKELSEELENVNESDAKKIRELEKEIARLESRVYSSVMIQEAPLKSYSETIVRRVDISAVDNLPERSEYSTG